MSQGTKIMLLNVLTYLLSVQIRDCALSTPEHDLTFYCKWSILFFLDSCGITEKTCLNYFLVSLFQYLFFYNGTIKG